MLARLRVRHAWLFALWFAFCFLLFACRWTCRRALFDGRFFVQVIAAFGNHKKVKAHAAKKHTPAEKKTGMSTQQRSHLAAAKAFIDALKVYVAAVDVEEVVAEYNALAQQWAEKQQKNVVEGCIDVVIPYANWHTISKRQPLLTDGVRDLSTDSALEFSFRLQKWSFDDLIENINCTLQRDLVKFKEKVILYVPSTIKFSAVVGADPPCMNVRAVAATFDITRALELLTDNRMRRSRGERVPTHFNFFRENHPDQAVVIAASDLCKSCLIG